MKKILFVATVAEHFRFFYLPYFAYFKSLGWQVDCVCSTGEVLPCCDTCYAVPVSRKPVKSGNLNALGQIKALLTNGGYDIVHCNTPVGGALTRIAAIKARKLGTKVVYTAHGFHFFAGAPMMNWLLYFPAELMLSRLTDCIVTINTEDYNSAKKHLKAQKIVQVHGVGYDTGKFVKPLSEKKYSLRRKYGYSKDEILLIYVAELNNNKNQQLLIKALKTLAPKNREIRLLLVGPDRTDGEIRVLAKKAGLEDRIDFFGQRTDVCEILSMCDLAVASSRREGLPVNIMESLACGLPVVATDNRGHRELIKDGFNGYLFQANDCTTLTRKIADLIRDKALYSRLSKNACNSVGIYGIECVLEEMKGVYGGL